MANELQSPPPSRAAAEWGLSAILLGGIVFVLFPLMVILIFGSMTLAHGDPYLQSRHIDFGVLGIYVVVGSLVVLAALALMCGLRGMVLGIKGRQPLGLAFAGTITGFLAVATALVLLQVTNHSVEWVRWLQKEVESGKSRINWQDTEGLPGHDHR